MASRWFRISFARNAFLRVLVGRELSLETLSLMHGIRAMEEFFAAHRPQHAELDELMCRWRPDGDGWEFSIVRRMQRHGHPVSELTVAFDYAASAARATEGEASVTTWRDVRDLDAYQATRGGRIRRRRLDQS